MTNEATNPQTKHADKMILPSSSQNIPSDVPWSTRESRNKSPIVSSFFFFFFHLSHARPSSRIAWQKRQFGGIATKFPTWHHFEATKGQRFTFAHCTRRLHTLHSMFEMVASKVIMEFLLKLSSGSSPPLGGIFNNLSLSGSIVAVPSWRCGFLFRT